MKNICPCPNLSCSNHGDCAKCTSSHIRKGYLNYCGFYTILPTLKQLMADASDEKTKEKINELIQPQLDAYAALMKKHNVSQQQCDELFSKFVEYTE